MRLILVTLLELSFSKNVNRTLRKHLKLYLSQYLEDQKSICGKAVSQEPPGSYFVLASMALV